ncbi:MAG: hypothetical protein PHW90_03265, partial [Bacilli bacterium]|nr:hypothetical protein [Bacilli bacterium]
ENIIRCIMSSTTSTWFIISYHFRQVHSWGSGFCYFFSSNVVIVLSKYFNFCKVIHISFSLAIKLYLV